MKTVLLIAYYFPPALDVAAKRAEGFFRHLARHGYRPIVLTVGRGHYLSSRGAEAVDGTDVVRVDDPGAAAGPRVGGAAARATRLPPTVRKVARRLYRELVQVPDAYRGFFRPGLAAALDIVRREPVRLVWATSSPYTSLRLGHALAGRTGLPWIADLRDLWVHHHFGYPLSPLRRLLDARLERTWLSSAAWITTATRGLERTLREQRGAAAPVTCIYGGYLDGPAPATSPEPGVLRICHAGTLWDIPGHSVGPLAAALDRVRARSPERFARIRVDFYGQVNPDFAVQLSRYGLDSTITYHGLVPRHEVAGALGRSDVPLLLLPDTQAQHVTVPAKTFDYLRARKPILALVPTAGEVATLLGAIGAGRCFAPSDTAGIARCIEELVDEKLAAGAVHTGADPDAVARFDYANLAGELAAIFDRVLAGRAP